MCSIHLYFVLKNVELNSSAKLSDLVRELKKLWNMKVLVILAEIVAFGTVPKGLEKRPEELKIRGMVETILTKLCSLSILLTKLFLQLY